MHAHSIKACHVHARTWVRACMHRGLASETAKHQGVSLLKVRPRGGRCCICYARGSGGWRLPGGGCRPEGTVQYKDRALQSPFRFSSKSGMLELRIELRGDEASDVLNFVLKDDATNSWCGANTKGNGVVMVEVAAAAAVVVMVVVVVVVVVVAR
eukprot:364840-Chlamydomonas_euryale.AAC.18